MSGSLILLPLRLGLRATSLAVRGAREIAEWAAGLVHGEPPSPDFHAAPDGPPTRTEPPPRPTQIQTAVPPDAAAAPPDTAGGAEPPLIDRGEPVDYDAPAPAEPDHIDTEAELVEEVAEPGAAAAPPDTDTAPPGAAAAPPDTAPPDTATAPPDTAGGAEPPLIDRGEPVDYDAPAPAEPDHIDTEAELVEEVAEPGAEDGAGAQVHVAEPWDGYRGLRAADVIDRLAEASPEELAAIELYELTSRKRKTVIAAAQRELTRRR
jgi:hypothetical protein